MEWYYLERTEEDNVRLSSVTKKKLKAGEKRGPFKQPLILCFMYNNTKNLIKKIFACSFKKCVLSEKK